MPDHETTKRRPNILVLMMDSVRAANVSCYGYRRPTTPHLDALAAQGSLYEQAISTGCWTLPVHSSLFTGRYSISHGVTLCGARLPADCPTLAGQLQEAGYQTACFSNNPFISAATGLTAGFETVEDLWQISHPRGIQRLKPRAKLRDGLRKLGPLGRPAIGLVRLYQRIRWAIQSRTPRRDSGAKLANRSIQDWLNLAWTPSRPFFIFVNYMECHVPYQPPAPYDARFLPRGASVSEAVRVTRRLMASGPSARPAVGELDLLEAMYDGELAYLDDRIGDLAASLAARGILDDTVLVIAADHGDGHGEHGVFGHRNVLYEPLVHVPLIVRYPARFPAGARLPQQVQLIDLYPTLLDLAGAAGRPGAADRWVDLPVDPAAPGRPFSIAENTSLRGAVERMVRTGRHKYIWRSEGPCELYDLRDDPDEMSDLAGREAETVRDLDARLRDWERSQEDDRIETRREEYDDAILDRLRDLGYVN